MNAQISRYLFRVGMLSALLCVLLIGGCGKPKEIGPVSPTDPNALSKVIVFPSDAQVVNGTLPQPSGTTTTTIQNNPSVSMTSGGSKVFVPIQFTGTTVISYVYVQITGASTYFKIPVPDNKSSALIYVPMSLPSNVLDGNFELTIVLVGSNGNVIASQRLTIPVEITLPLDCGNGFVSGSSGITQTEHQLAGKAGKVSITYDTYSLPDRIDVYVDGQWVAGTGSSIAPPPPLSTCSNPLAGFVGKSGTFTFNVSSSSKRVQTYVSGCTGSSTAWNYTLTCP